MVPGWIEPSGRMASQRSQMVVAPRSTWYSHDGISRRSSIRYASSNGPRRPAPAGPAACQEAGATRPSAVPDQARQRVADAPPVCSGATPNCSATAQPVWVVAAWSPSAPRSRLATSVGECRVPVRGRRVPEQPRARRPGGALWTKKALARNSESGLGLPGPVGRRVGVKPVAELARGTSRPSGPSRRRASRPSAHAGDLAPGPRGRRRTRTPTTARSRPRPPSPRARSARSPSSTTSGHDRRHAERRRPARARGPAASSPEGLGVEQRASGRRRRPAHRPSSPAARRAEGSRWGPRRSCPAATRRRSRADG